MRSIKFISDEAVNQHLVQFFLDRSFYERGIIKLTEKMAKGSLYKSVHPGTNCMYKILTGNLKKTNENSFQIKLVISIDNKNRNNHHQKCVIVLVFGL